MFRWIFVLELEKRGKIYKLTSQNYWLKIKSKFKNRFFVGFPGESSKNRKNRINSNR